MRTAGLGGPVLSLGVVIGLDGKKRIAKKALKFTFNKHLECNTLGYMLATKKRNGVPAYHMLREGGGGLPALS